MASSFLKRLFGDSSTKELKKIEPLVKAVEALEDQYSAYVDLGDGDRGVHDIVRQCRALQIRSGAE